MTSMMQVEPHSLIFRNVTLNQTYTTSVCISNPLTSSVEFTLRASDARYALTPSKVTLGQGQSIVITVRLTLSHYPSINKGIKGVTDYIHIKSRYFEQNISVTFFLDSGSKTALEGRPPLSITKGAGEVVSVHDHHHQQLEWDCVIEILLIQILKIYLLNLNLNYT